MNKKLILILCILTAASTLKAQTQKGNQLIGGNISGSTNQGTSDYYYKNGSYSSSYDSKTKANSFFIGPSYSFFIADHLDLGVSAGYGTSKITNTYLNYINYDGQTEVLSRSFSGSVYLRKYFLYNNKIGIRTGPFIGYQYSNYHIKYQDPLSDFGQTERNFNAGLGLDLVYFPIRRLGIASTIGSLAYAHYDTKGYYTHDKSNGVSLSLVSALNLSIFYCLGK